MVKHVGIGLMCAGVVAAAGLAFAAIRQAQNTGTVGAAIDIPGAVNLDSGNKEASSDAADLPMPSPDPSPLPVRHLLDVPFMVQAPFGRWDRDIFQEGCEEASLLMAWHFLQGTSLTEGQVAEEIEKLAVFQEEAYGTAIDTSAEDTAKTMRNYFGHNNVSVRYNIEADDIKREIAAGNVVITPMDGRKLGNPHYTVPGPDKHMLAVVGYDDKSKLFITNDPGTKHGKGFQYGQDVFMSAIRDYPTGNRLPVHGHKRAMIVIGPA